MKVAASDIDIRLIRRSEFSWKVIKAVKEEHARITRGAYVGSGATIVRPDTLEEWNVEHHKAALNALGVRVVDVMKFIWMSDHLAVVADDDMIASGNVLRRACVVLMEYIAAVIEI